MADRDDVSEFLSQNRELATWVETVRGECESDKLWRRRREFILRNMSDFCGDGQRPPDPDTNHLGLDRLLAYSMVWTNHVFTGCCYPLPVMEKVLKMAENIKVTDVPVHTTRDELVSKVKKRGISSIHEGLSEEPKKQKSTDCASTVMRDVSDKSNYEVAASQEKINNSESHQHMVKGPSPFSANIMKKPRRLTSEDVKERQPFFNKLYKTIAWKLVSAGGFSPNLNHSELLSSSIESLKSSLDISFVPLRDLTDLPQSKTSQENMVCELRCRAVYLGMGCGKTNENAKAVASREALKLFLKKKLSVRICKRKYSGQDVEDLVLLDDESRTPVLPPSLKNPLDLI